MKTILGIVTAATLLSSAAFALGDKYSHPNYNARNDYARHRAVSTKGLPAALAKPAGTNVPLDKELKKLESQSAAAQARAAAKPAAKAWAAPQPNPARAEKNKPINFQYVPRKNATLQNNRAANAPTRKLIKCGYR